MTFQLLYIPLDWSTHPDCIRLREADPANPDRWIHLLRRTALSQDEGRLRFYDGTPVGAKELSMDHDRDVESWQRFIDLCLELGLLEYFREDEDDLACLYLDSWSLWLKDFSEEDEES